MKLKVKIHLICVFIVLFVVGCGFSFHSNQYQLAKSALSAFKTEKEVQRPRLDWMLSWADIDLPVLAMEVDNEIWFVAKEDIVVTFDGWQIKKVQNLFPGQTDVAIEMQDIGMIIRENGREIEKYNCLDWVGLTDSQGEGTIFRQDCRTLDRDFQNIIRVNSNGNIIELVYNTHPNYPSLLIRRI